MVREARLRRGAEGDGATMVEPVATGPDDTRSVGDEPRAGTGRQDDRVSAPSGVSAGYRNPWWAKAHPVRPKDHARDVLQLILRHRGNREWVQVGSRTVAAELG